MTKSEYLEVFNSADFFQILTLLGMVHLFLTPTGAFVEQDPYVEWTVFNDIPASPTNTWTKTTILQDTTQHY